jgi:sugar lactone lactonase YvrE
MYSQEVMVASCGESVSSPMLTRDGQLFVCVGGNVMRVRDDRLFRSYSTGGMLSGAVYDDSRQLLYAADMAQAAIIALRDRSQDIIVSEYEDKPLKGPHSLVCTREGTVFFTDSGPLGTTGLHSAKGSLFMVHLLSSDMCYRLNPKHVR